MEEMLGNGIDFDFKLSFFFIDPKGQFGKLNLHREAYVFEK